MEKIYRAIDLIEQNNTEEALRILANHLPHAEEEELFTIADLYQELGLITEAKEVLYDLLPKYPDEADVKIALAEIHIDLEEDPEAIELLNSINEKDPQYLSVLLLLADLYQAQGLFEVAEQKLLQAKQLEPSELLIDFALAELAFSNGEYQKAITHYEKVYREQKVFAAIDISHRLAEANASIGEFETALEHYQTAESDDTETLFRYGFIGFQANRLDIAIKSWEKVLELDPEYPSVYQYLAEVYESEGLIPEAYSTAKKGLAMDSLNKDLFLLAGMLARKIGESEKGYQFVREAVAIDPGFKEAVLFLVENYKDDEDFQAIIDLLTHIIDQGEEDGYYKWELAKALEKEEEYQQALKFYQDAYNTFKDDSDFLKEYGYFLVEEGRKNDAISIFTRYLAIEPSDTELEAYLSRLKA
ncbi:tetratricopeptide (TPR) repeat protein [Natronobacillus azotifigens]|uniref:Tetratricopeptide repeat protein n=1 Tax=Natronobacillus azotifigens TaxID=472978 RepID=A0A9J6R980_9BACI|nr:tetratricopeptide repeat protein [Natronobacillus azotifigens]MCZ0701867.1 tetratricopeptide repeat protein [Natronobacillus azotifigens]